jgi:hypothetical protein
MSLAHPLFGIIDIGSNTIRLVIYDCLNRSPLIVYTEKATCELARGIEKQGVIESERFILALANRHLCGQDCQKRSAACQRGRSHTGPSRPCHFRGRRSPFIGPRDYCRVYPPSRHHWRYWRWQPGAGQGQRSASVFPDVPESGASKTGVPLGNRGAQR